MAVGLQFTMKERRITSKAGDFKSWNELFGKEHEPSDEQIAEFVDSPLWSDLADHLLQTYNV